MPDLVRVRDQRTGHEYTVTAEAAKAGKEVLTVLATEPAADDQGRHLPPVYSTEQVLVTEPAKTTAKKES